MVIYDITDDELRNKVASFLKSKGLKRVQKSAFVGDISYSQMRDVEAGLSILVRGAKANIQIYPLTPASFSQRRVIGAQMDYEAEEYLI